MLVVDFARGWTDPTSPLALPADTEVQAAAALVAAARSSGVPVAFSTVVYAPGEDIPIVLLKAPRVRCMTPGSPWIEIDPRLEVAAGERVVVKRHASAFFETDLAQWFGDRDVDTLLLAGCVTSGCVRASAVDAAQHGFRPLVVRDAVVDRSVRAHEANLIDIEQRYGDVIELDEALAIISFVRS